MWSFGLASCALMGFSTPATFTPSKWRRPFGTTARPCGRQTGGKTAALCWWICCGTSGCSDGRRRSTRCSFESSRGPSTSVSARPVPPPRRSRPPFLGWRLFVGDRSPSNVTLVEVQGQRQLVLGHTALLAGDQLSWLREATMRGGDMAADREARRVLVRAIHEANLLAHGGHTRLHEHSPHGHAMYEYFQRVADATLKRALATSQIDELRVLQTLPNGNSLVCGQLIPKQVMWARLVAGSSLSLNGGLRWRGPVASAVLAVAQENVEQWGNVSRTAIHRHVYSVMRRWLVDWMMYIWWDLDIPDGAVDDGVAFFGLLRVLLLESLVNNTQSLPHAVGELLVSAPKPDDVVTILGGTLGGGWELWASAAVTISGVPLVTAMGACGEWLCDGRAVGEDVAVDQRLYLPVPLERVLQTPATAPEGQQARALLAGRIVDTLVARVRTAWEALPAHLVDAPETVAENVLM
eukprot:TRINITY_DN13731_c0_g1_i1.p1 TRINITY_DN13731_c0_g1~~TRINITY_DN13731_c0_g1_i1.p1  ORF type:complete len:466 (-),score=100.54 TRINITY_DN13731_c0_g1_i1:202-1599(-)